MNTTKEELRIRWSIIGIGALTAIVFGCLGYREAAAGAMGLAFVAVMVRT